MIRTVLALFAAASLWGGELRFALHAEPKTFDPFAVSEQAGETVRYLTGGVLVRVNRLTQKPEPELAESWKVLDGGRTIEFRIRRNVKFSDGTPFGAGDVAFTIRKLMSAATRSPSADAFGAVPKVTETGENIVRIEFPRVVAALERHFDQVAIVPAREVDYRAPAAIPVLGPYRVREHKPGAYILLGRNPHYWRTGLPRLDAVRLVIQSNRDLELLRFERGELDLMASLSPADFDRLKGRAGLAPLDLGPSLSFEQIWFNQAAAAPLSAHVKEWFGSREFRNAVSAAINRADICRIAYHGRAIPAAGPVSPANRLWHNPRIRPPAGDSKAALARAGFRLDGGALRDRGGNAVEFSLLTNAGNRTRERIAALVQQDVARIGIRINIVTLDFPALIERIARTFRYEACLLGMVNVDPDPNGQMNVWLSSAATHPWNPGQAKPATAWEAEIDRLMLAQASEPRASERKRLFDRVQEIAAEQQPIVFLVHPNALAAASARVANLQPSVLTPQTYWNIERLDLTRP